jgi:hypothetical protein
VDGTLHTELLNVQTDSKDITENTYTTDSNNVPDKIEVNMLDLETAVRQMKNDKSPGYDELTTEMIKTVGPIGTQWLYQILRRIWTENIMSEDCYKGIIIPVYKKGDRRQCGNYSGITLLYQRLQIYGRALASKMIQEIRGNRTSRQIYVPWKHGREK